MKDKKKELVEKAKKSKIEEAQVDVDTRNKVGFLIIGLALLVLISCGIYWSVNGNQENQEKLTDAQKFEEEYEKFNEKHNEKYDYDYSEVEIDEENPIQYATYEEVFKLLDSGTGIVYFGFPECPWCRTLVPSMLESAKETGIDTIYYLNILEDRDILELDENKKVVTKKEASENYKKLVKKLDSVLNEYVLKSGEKEIKTGEKRLYFPTVLAVNNGKIVGFHEGTLEEHTDSSKELTKKQKEELVKTLSDLMSETLACNGAC